MDRLYYSFSQFLKERFGYRVHKLSLNAGFLCPNIDGTLSSEGCIFCNNRAFSYFVNKEASALEEQISSSIDFARRRFKAKKFVAYFQSFTNTYADLDLLKERYDTIRKFPDIVGLSISTRPDCIDEKKLELIESFTKEYMVWVEFGLQTAHDKSLTFLNRNHTFGDFLKAVRLAHNRNILIGVHIILGIPNETKQDMLSTAKGIASLPLSGIKFHCLHVVKNTSLETLYRNSQVVLLTMNEYIDILIGFLELIPEDWVILRLLSEAHKDLLNAPLWVNTKGLFSKELEQRMRERNTYQGKCFRRVCP